jgi:hypothetical protein
MSFSQPSLLHIYPLYKEGSVWYYDDPNVNVYKEPFVCGASELIDKVAAADGIADPKGIYACADNPDAMPNGHHAYFVSEENGGANYYSREFNHHFWLCGHLYDYFPSPPRILSFKLHG